MVLHLILEVKLTGIWAFHVPVAAILDCSHSDHQGDTPTCLRWFLKTLYPYLSPCQISKTCHQVHDSTFIWHIPPLLMYINLHTIGLTGATELGTVTSHFAPNRRRFHWSISQWILLRRKHIFIKSLKSSLSLFVPSFRFFQHPASTISPF